MDFPSRQTEKQYAISGTTSQTPAPIEPGNNLEMVMKSKQNAPLLGHNTTVLLKLTGGECNSDRPGLDLVVVVDVTSRMRGDLLRALKVAMRFVVRKLSAADGLSIIAFAASSTLLCPLRQITEASQREMEELIDRLEDMRSWDERIDIEEAVRHALKVLDSRKVSVGRVAGVMLVSHNPEMMGVLGKVHVGSVAVYTFGFGLDSETGRCCSEALNRVADGSMGGTFSHILVMRLFATTRMDMYLEQAKKFHNEPTMMLPSVEDDLKEELTINAAKLAAALSLNARQVPAVPAGAASRRLRFCCW